MTTSLGVTQTNNELPSRAILIILVRPKYFPLNISTVPPHASVCVCCFLLFCLYPHNSDQWVCFRFFLMNFYTNEIAFLLITQPWSLGSMFLDLLFFFIIFLFWLMCMKSKSVARWFVCCFSLSNDKICYYYFSFSVSVCGRPFLFVLCVCLGNTFLTRKKSCFYKFLITQVHVTNIREASHGRNFNSGFFTEI